MNVLVVSRPGSELRPCGLDSTTARTTKHEFSPIASQTKQSSQGAATLIKVLVVAKGSGR